MIWKILLSLFFMFVMVFSMSSYAAKQQPDHQQKSQKLITKTVQTVKIVDINQSDAAQLVTLKGMGPKTAERIVAYRKQNGPFKSLEGLAKVRGVSKALVARLSKENPGRLVVKSVKAK